MNFLSYNIKENNAWLEFTIRLLHKYMCTIFSIYNNTLFFVFRAVK